jgi:NADPH:quinone reductase-like Zn-dependent oxidoreductase
VDAVAPAAGETVLVCGATGGVGAHAVQLAVSRGAEVIATARPGEEADLVGRLGAAHAIDYTDDVPAAVRSVRADGVDAIVHLVGDGLQLAELLVLNGAWTASSS